jgi:uncharacterized protein YerC
MEKYYRKTRLKNGNLKKLHRIITEQHIGRKLTYNEVVHHINGDTLDNRLENLQLMSRAEHSSLHIFKDGPTVKMFTREQILEWHKMKSEGLSYHEISRRTGTRPYTINRILNGMILAYKDIVKEIQQNPA